MDDVLKNTTLGQKTAFVDHYDPTLLDPIARATSRSGLGISDELPFQGEDIWNAYELSWLDSMGKPQVAIAEVRVPASSPHLVESKSFKLYLNSFANTRFANRDEVIGTIERDISATAGAPVTVQAHSLNEAARVPVWQGEGECLDHLPLLQSADEATIIGKAWLQHDGKRQDEVSEAFYTHLVRSLCPVTGQPDWATVMVRYTGRAISAQHLLQYLVSFRQQTGFHEHVVEQAFVDITEALAPSQLMVMARFTRRGGLDINPYRSSEAVDISNVREIRQ